MERLILKRRDRYSLELKFRYLLRRQRKDTQFFRLYFFLPASFNINPETYDRERFFANRKIHIRLNTPSFSTRNLLDASKTDSPLIRLEQMFRDVEQPETDFDAAVFIDECKLLGAVYKSLLRDTCSIMTRQLEKEIERHRNTTEKKLNFLRYTQELQEAVEISRRFHALEEGKIADEKVQNAYILIDEYVSLLVERYFLVLAEELEAYKECKQFREFINDLVFSELLYRKKKQYPTFLEGNPEKRRLEEYIYREKVLKRYASEVLFFHIKHTDEARRKRELLYAFAAGIAMMVATGIAFYGQTVFEGITVSLFVLLVAGYMLKDRIKDFFRDILSRTLGSRLFDKRNTLYRLRSRKKLGILKERVCFIKEGKLDSKVIETRGKARLEQQVADHYPEQVLLYEKKIKLKDKKIHKFYRRMSSLADIGIFEMEPFFRHLAVQRGSVPVVTGKGKIKRSDVKRMYHLSLLLHFREGDREVLHRFRLIVDGKGIKRIEPASPGLRERSIRGKLAIVG
jgi:hypothetical protein